jgi:putative PIN family toxin of toxin-antitoxin system
MIAAVIDTNVFISAILADRTPLAAIETTRKGQTRLLVTTAILDEIERVMLRPKFTRYFQAQGITPSTFILNYAAFARHITPETVTDCPIQDAKDLIFIECAVAGQADYIVSGDHHLLELKAYRNIQIVTPAQFLIIVDAVSENDSSLTLDE